jgi:cyclase
MADFICSLGRAANRLIYTHGHNDHVLGSAVFCGGEVVAHDLMPAVTRRLLPDMAARVGASQEELAARIAWPTITFSHEMSIDLGGRLLRLFPTPGHSQDGVSIYLEKERLLIAGDAVVTAIVPAIGDGDSRILQATLEQLVEMEIEILVPGHGEVVVGQAAARDWLRWISNYLAGVRAAVRTALERNVPPDAIAESIEFDRFVGQRLPKERHKMLNRHYNTVQKIIREELA